MFKINNLTVKNFMSIGNQTQSVNLDRNDLTLVLGENLDVGGGDAGARNGTGKTTIINALSYALYGTALTNIKKDNLINKTNGKNMLVTVDFEKNGQHYRIERGRKPGLLKFYVGGHEVEDESEDEAQGDSRATQSNIESHLGLSHTMFKHVLALNTYTEPFLSLKSNDQREIIEQLLGITQLSQKAENLKELIKNTKNMIQEEEYRIKAVQDANHRITEQIDSLKRRQKLWLQKHNDNITEIESALTSLGEIEIDREIEKHQLKADIIVKRNNAASEEKWIKSFTKNITQNESLIEKLEREIASLENHECYACGSKIHDDKQQEIIVSKKSLLSETRLTLEDNINKKEEHETVLAEIGDIPDLPDTWYDSLEEALNHKSTVANLEEQLEKMSKESDPYTEQIDDMEREAIEEVTWDYINELSKLKDHQEFLYKLLTNKDSFIRKKIIDQNLTFLNTRLEYYLKKIGLPHSVEFKNDLNVEIQELGRDLDFDNLSRGERNRLILSLSWAFRDVWENLYHPINLLFIDELVDSGMDSSGVESSMGVLKKMARDRNKSIWLISHKDELISRVHNVLKVVKENGFTNYSDTIDIV